MRKIPIPMRLLSVAFWGSLDRYGLPPTKEFQECEKNREKASLDTGSLSIEDAQTLWKLARGFQPKVIAEVGTFIGRSTTALRMGSGAKIYTCDKDNDCFSMDGVITHPKKDSTQMLSGIQEPIDLFFIDGRLNLEDVGLIKKLKKPETVFIFDDFQGMEKGVINVARLEPILKGNIFIQPITGGLALSMPPEVLAISVQ